MENSGDLMQSLVAKLYNILTGDDESIDLPRNKFVSWFLPGVPFDPKDFKFAARGFVGDTAEEINEAYHQAWVVSKLFDYIPDVSNDLLTDEMKQTLFAGTQDTISSVYDDVLKYSRVVHRELSDSEKQKLKKFRDLLSVEVEETDILTDEVKTVTRPGKLTIAYTNAMNDYIHAADEYMNLKIDAMAATGDSEEAKRRVLAFANKSKFVRSKMEAASNAWVAQGYKNEYETIQAYISQVTEKNLVLYKQDLRKKLDSGKLTSPSDGDFYYTTLLPGNFASSDGWTRFTFTEEDGETHFEKKTNKWGAKGGVNFGLFSVGASASGSKNEYKTDAETTNFSAEFEYAQIPICRPFFEPGFFWMRSWTLDEIWDLTFDKTVSDGADQPAGRLVAYPVSALFVRNVKLTSSNWSSHMDFVEKTVKAGGSVGYGPIRLGGSYESGSQKRNTNYHLDGDTLTIEGLQLIGTINNVIPKCPNTHPDLKPEDFVGGAEGETDDGDTD
jgi:hypothetical protein